MSEAINLISNVEKLDIGNPVTGYSQVEIYAGQDDNGEEVIYRAGDETGKTLQIRNELGSQLMATKILNRIRGFQYQPYEASSAILDPAFELGDGVTINGIYSGIFQKKTKFGALMASDISAPYEEEIEHEFSMESASDRQYSRFVSATKAALRLTSQEIAAEVSRATEAEGELSSTLSIHATDIAARVTKNGGSRESFGWELQSDHWSVYSNNTEVLRVTASGAKVKGRIEATEGYIGSENNGFTITARAIYNNISEYGGSQSTGVYIGTNGIQIGQGFKVSSSGYLEATSGTFSGTVYASHLSGTIDGDRQISSGSIGGGGGGALSSSCISGIGWGNNLGLSNNRQYTFDWLQSINCSITNINGTHVYVLDVDCNAIDTSSIRFSQYSGHSCYWNSSVTVATSAYASSTVTWSQSGEWLSAVGGVSYNTTTLSYIGD